MAYPQNGVPYTATETAAIAQLTAAGVGTTLATLVAQIKTARTAVGASVNEPDWNDLVRGYWAANYGPSLR